MRLLKYKSRKGFSKVDWTHQTILKSTIVISITVYAAHAVNHPKNQYPSVSKFLPSPDDKLAGRARGRSQADRFVGR